MCRPDDSPPYEDAAPAVELAPPALYGVMSLADCAAPAPGRADAFCIRVIGHDGHHIYGRWSTAADQDPDPYRDGEPW